MADVNPNPEPKQTDTAPVTSAAEKPAAEPVKAKSSNKTLVIVLVIVGVLFVLPGVLLAVGGFWLSRGDNAEKITESVIENATGADVDIDKDGSSVNIKTEDGSVSYGTEQKLPDDLPDSVVMYDNQTVVGVLTSNQDGTGNWNISAETDDEVSKVTEFIESKYVEKGWTESSSATYNGIASYSYEKDTLDAYITVSPADEDNKAIVSYVIREKSQE